MQKDNIAQLIMMSALLFCTLLFLSICFFLLIEGGGVLSVPFLLKNWSHTHITEGGIFPAIIGTILLTFWVSIVSLPFGFGTALYLSEYAQHSMITRILRLTLRNLAGVPSVVYGLFGLAFFVLSLHIGTSLLAAALTLGCMTLPWIITASEESLKAVPHAFREASYALGATKWQTIQTIVLPQALSGMLTGSVLGISRVMGETAPIIMVGATFFMSYVSFSPFEKFMALPYHIFILATQHSSIHARAYAAATALVLLSIVFFANLTAFILRYRLRARRV